MGLWDSFCGDTSLHGYQYIGRRERRPLWAGIVITSIILAVYFLKYNILEYMSSFTTTSLQTTTSSLDNIFYPSVTVCNMNQIRPVFCFVEFRSVNIFLGIPFGEKLDWAIKLMQGERSLSLISLLGPRSLSLNKNTGKCVQFCTRQLSRNLFAIILYTQVWICNEVSVQGPRYY